MLREVIVLILTRLLLRFCVFELIEICSGVCRSAFTSPSQNPSHPHLKEESFHLASGFRGFSPWLLAPGRNDMAEGYGGGDLLNLERYD